MMYLASSISESIYRHNRKGKHNIQQIPILTEGGDDMGN